MGRRKSIKVNALLNMIKQIMQVIFPLITVPYIARVLGRENYGKINTGSALISYISLIAGLGILSYAIREGALVRGDRVKLNSFSCQVFSINLLSTIFAYIVLIVIILFIPHYQNYRLLLIIQGVSVVFTTLGADWVNSIEEDYLYLTIRYIVLHIVALILMFLFVKKPEDYYLYAAITLITTAGANLMNIFYIQKYIRLRFTLNIDWKKHLPPILVLFSNSVAMTIYVSSDITMIEIYKGDSEVGIYGVATKIYTIVKQVLNAILVVSIPRLTLYMKSEDRAGFSVLGSKMLGALITLMCPLVSGLIVYRSEALYFAGGNEYLSGSDSLLILSAAIPMAMFATFFSACILMPLKMEKTILRGTAISAIINVALNFIFIPIWGINGAAITTLISEIFVAVYFGVCVCREGFQLIKLRVLLLSVLGGFVVMAICMCIKSCFTSFIVNFPLSLISSCIVYGIIQVVGKNDVLTELVPVLKKKGLNDNS